MPERIRPIDVYRKLVEYHRTLNHLGNFNGNQYELEKCARLGIPIPDNLLPGRTIMKLSDEEREALSQLTSNEIANEINWYEYHGVGKTK